MPPVFVSLLICNVNEQGVTLVKENLMSMSTEAVLAMASKLQESRAESNPVEEVKEGMQPEAVETNDTLPDDKNVSDGPTVQETEEPSEAKPTDTAPKAAYSKQEQQNHAFTKLKAKERAKREKLEARIRELEEQNRRYKDVKLDTFDGDQEKYTDFVVERKLADAERNRLLEEKRQSQLAEYDAINEQRVNSCFKDEKDRAVYNKLLDEHGGEFAQMLDKADPDGVILGYLDDSDISPMLIRILMTNPEYRNRVLSKSNPFTRLMAMQDLEAKVTNAMQAVSRKASAPKKPAIPVIGSVTKSEGGNGQLDRNDPNYYNNLLRDLNARKR